MESKLVQLIREFEKLKSLIEEETGLVDAAADLLNRIEKMFSAECRWPAMETKVIYRSNDCKLAVEEAAGKCYLLVDCHGKDKGYAFYWLMNSIDEVIEKLKSFNDRYAKRNKDMKRKLEAFEKVLTAVTAIR